MVAKNELNTIDDVARMTGELLSEIQNKLRGGGYDQRVGELLAEADNPDDVFKARILMNCLDQLSRIALQISYLNLPVTRQGILRQRFQGRVELGEETIPNGTRLEYFSGGEWYYGILHRNDATGQNVLLDWKGDVMLDKIDGVQARVRGKPCK